jgi:hypothetical protein
MGCTRLVSFTIVLLFLTQLSWGQTLVDDAKLPLTQGDNENVFIETIKVIGQSKKIFILSNNNQILGVGDFISLAINNELATRAVVAKIHEDRVGIKVIKIYSLTQWTKLQKGLEVQVIRGDDSMFGKKVAATAVDSTEEAPRIKDEEDLFSIDDLDGSGELSDDSKRHIKPDNLVGVGFGFYDATEPDVEGGGARATQFSGSWAYQFADNWFAEFVYARAMLSGYPASDAQTLVNNVVGRLKFNFKAPLYSFIMPYIGFQSQSVSSNAGETGNVAQDDRELSIISGLQKTGPVFGVSIYRRLVPGWFLKADLGTDVINAGVSIEF